MFVGQHKRKIKFAFGILTFFPSLFFRIIDPMFSLLHFSSFLCSLLTHSTAKSYLPSRKALNSTLTALYTRNIWRSTVSSKYLLSLVQIKRTPHSIEKLASQPHSFRIDEFVIYLFSTDHKVFHD